jgi:hypothetical protein
VHWTSSLSSSSCNAAAQAAFHCYCCCCTAAVCAACTARGGYLASSYLAATGESSRRRTSACNGQCTISNTIGLLAGRSHRCTCSLSAVILQSSGHLRNKRGGNEPHVTQDAPACARTALGSRGDALMPAVLSERTRQRGSPALILATGHRLEQQQLALLVAASSSAAVESAPCSGRSYSF